MGMFTFTTDDVEVAEAVLALIGGDNEPVSKAPSKPAKAPKASPKVKEPEDDDLDDADADFEEYSEATLKKMPIADLREVAEEFEIDSKGLKKPDLIEAILDAQEEELDAGPAADEDDDLDDLDDDEAYAEPAHHLHHPRQEGHPRRRLDHQGRRPRLLRGRQ